MRNTCQEAGGAAGPYRVGPGAMLRKVDVFNQVRRELLVDSQQEVQCAVTYHHSKSSLWPELVTIPDMAPRGAG